MMGIFEKLLNGKELTEAEKEVGAYIVANCAKIASLTLNGVARNTFTSNATVLRLCKKLGYRGYRDFQIAYVAEMYARNRGMTGTGDVSQPRTATQKIIELHLYSMSAAAEYCSSVLDAGMLTQAASWVSGAENFYILGNGDALLVAMAFANQLSAVGIHPILPQNYNDGVSLITGITEKDTVMVVSFSREISPAIGWQLGCLTGKECSIISIMAKDNPIDTGRSIKIPITIGKDDPLYEFRCRIMLDCILCCISTSLQLFLS